MANKPVEELKNKTIGQIRTMYANGRSVSQIMGDTGQDYGKVKGALDATKTKLITGGPHDTRSCRHSH